MVGETASISSCILQDIQNRVDDLKTPVELQMKVADHIAHLQHLTETLRKFGMDEATIGRQVVELFERYEAQLLLVMSASYPDMERKGAEPC